MIKRLLRIVIGILLSPPLLILSTWVWLFREERYPFDFFWYLVSGQWEELPE